MLIAEVLGMHPPSVEIIVIGAFPYAPDPLAIIVETSATAPAIGAAGNPSAPIHGASAVRLLRNDCRCSTLTTMSPLEPHADPGRNGPAEDDPDASTELVTAAAQLVVTAVREVPTWLRRAVLIKGTGAGIACFVDAACCSDMRTASC